MNDLVAEGKITPVVGSTFPLVDGAHAVAAFETGRVTGRIVLTP